MILSKEQIQSTIAEFFADKPVNKVWLFGSYARGDADEKSDVDVLVDLDFSKTIGLGYFSWHENLRDLLNKDVHVIAEGGIHKFIKPYVEKDKIIIYEK
jgi:predicted nucleotidyltransferase